MKYLTLVPDYTLSCIREDFDGNIEETALGLPLDFIDELIEWHMLYRKIIPLEDEQRIKLIKEIEVLDQQGISLAKRLMRLVPGGAKVKYFSEGLMKYLAVD